MQIAWNNSRYWQQDQNLKSGSYLGQTGFAELSKIKKADGRQSNGQVENQDSLLWTWCAAKQGHTWLTRLCSVKLHLASSRIVSRRKDPKESMHIAQHMMEQAVWSPIL